MRVRLAIAVAAFGSALAAAAPPVGGQDPLKREFDRLTERVVSGDPGRSLLAEIPAALALADSYRRRGDGAKEGATFVTASNLAQLGGDYRRAVALADRGRDPSVASLGGHWGVLGMRERAEGLGGSFGIWSAPGEGSVVSVMVPSGARP